jgi:amino acid transporter
MDLIPYKTPFGVIGSYLGLGLNILALIASFYTALYPASGASPNAKAFFSSYLAFFTVALFYVGYKIFTRKWRMYIPASEMDLATGAVMLDEPEPKEPMVWSQLPKRALRNLF